VAFRQAIHTVAATSILPCHQDGHAAETVPCLMAARRLFRHRLDQRFERAQVRLQALDLRQDE